MAVRRIYVKKRPGFDVAAKRALNDFKETLRIEGLTDVSILVRYDVEGMDDVSFENAVHTIFSEPMADEVFFEEHQEIGQTFAVEYLPGQYDQRADSAAQCVQLLTQGERPLIQTATVYSLYGNINQIEQQSIQEYIINPVDSRLADSAKKDTLKLDVHPPENIELITGFSDFSQEQIKQMVADYGFAMKAEDLAFTQSYFKEEGRDPYIAELRVIDTYWSDHCRHTTFLTRLNKISFGNSKANDGVKAAYQAYLKTREAVYKDRNPKNICLMDLATIYTKYAKKQGWLTDLDESEEINACSIKQDVWVDGEKKPYLIMFKNETHNHPTEIEPFGGAATCLGGAIRDPLSGRSYVYQAMRVTGAGDVTQSVKNTIQGRLPQKKISKEAAHGYSSYGNQIGLATGLVDEIYHPGYMAKRMEIGAVIGAAPAENVYRTRPEKGDVVILLGGRTGRDGIGGATGSSKSHDESSITDCGAEVQKGNPLTERKLQRLYRNSAFTKMVKRCNDFGAGGVCVAVGELTDGLDIDLDKVPKKYEGLNGTEISISESQERMAVVVNADDLDAVLALAHEENLEAVKIADVTDTKRMRMFWRGEKIVDIKREFLDTNGVTQNADAHIDLNNEDLFSEQEKGTPLETLKTLMSDLNLASKKGLIEMFDSTIGAATVNMPLGGKRQLTPVQAMAAKVPIPGGTSGTATLMSYGFDPYLSEKNPFIGSMHAVVNSLAKLVASGGNIDKAWLTFQEYFERLEDVPEKWGKPLSALLGAFVAQQATGAAAIGGKDSMSGTFKDINVPPTLVSFAVTTEEAKQIISNEFKSDNSNVYLVSVGMDDDGLFDFDDLKSKYSQLYAWIKAGKIKSACAIERGGIGAAIAKMTLGNAIGFKYDSGFSKTQLFKKAYANILIETDEKMKLPLVGITGGDVIDMYGEQITVDALTDLYLSPLAKVFPYTAKSENTSINIEPYTKRSSLKAVSSIAKPRVVLPIFPGTNCEYDSAAAFEQAGAVTTSLIIRNLSPQDIEQSIDALVEKINISQILMIPGGFSGGDEPDGSGKFIATTLRNPKVKDAVHRLLNERDGLILGICNGFQALIKVGLLPYGEIRDMRSEDATLTFNTIGRHISRLVDTKILSVNSPWMNQAMVGDIHTVAVSHGEGRLAIRDAEMIRLAKSGQIATQYVDDNGNPSSDGLFNPNGSVAAIEGLFSPDGRVFGKMGHNERSTAHAFKNVPGLKDNKIFLSGVQYYK